MESPGKQSMFISVWHFYISSHFSVSLGSKYEANSGTEQSTFVSEATRQSNIIAARNFVCFITGRTLNTYIYWGTKTIDPYLGSQVQFSREFMWDLFRANWYRDSLLPEYIRSPLTTIPTQSPRCVLRAPNQHIKFIFLCCLFNDAVSITMWLPLWSNGQSSWVQIQRSRVRFPALSDFLRSSRSGTGSIQPHEDNWGATWKENSGSGLENRN
jgi:hypothetical protein